MTDHRTYVEIGTLEIVNHTLKIDMYVPGCDPPSHYTFCWDERFVETDPVQVNLWLDFERNGTCEEAKPDSREFDLTPLRKAYEEAYGSKSGVIDISIYNPIPAYSGSIRYAFCDRNGSCCNAEGEPCEHGCDRTECYPECNPVNNCCEEDGTLKSCENSCNPNTGECYPHCQPFLDSCCDSNGDFCTECDDRSHCNLISCKGGLYDPTSNL